MEHEVPFLGGQTRLAHEFDANEPTIIDGLGLSQRLLMIFAENMDDLILSLVEKKN